jgi:hypothetical protein
MPRLAALVLAFSWTLALSVDAQTDSAQDNGSGAVRLHVGMWTTHLWRPTKGLDANWLVAVAWKGMYGGSFINSFGDRAFAAGLERSLARSDDGRLARGVGYRIGVVAGYDERLTGIAGTIPILPAFQMTSDVAVAGTGLELAWAGKVATLSPFMHVRR